MKTRHGKLSRLVRVVCLVMAMAMLLSSCDVIGNLIPWLIPDGTSNPDVICADNNGDHLCDDCSKVLSECVDKNNDHKCDVCSQLVSECEDSDGNHKCDVCSETFGKCTDKDNDHKCDLCSTVISVCESKDANHQCDVCEKVLSDCVDVDKNHKCDVCSAVISICSDKTNDHKCDVCLTVISACTEGDDHKCVICSKIMSYCSDQNSDHKCDVCDEWITTCIDNDNDHKCDFCEKIVSVCIAVSGHTCEICGKSISECMDYDKDHKCDTCADIISECTDGNSNHQCDVCGKIMNECNDENGNHECDVCGKVISVCADKNKDHECDVCSLILSECEDISPIDHVCDVCGITLSECVYVDRVCEICGDTTIYKHVVIIGVDGAGSFFKDTPTPNMDAIFANGAITYTGITETPSISAECWASLIHGVNASVHGITANSQGSYPIDSDYPSFFRVIRENNPSAELGSYTTWNTINNLIVEDGLGITKVGWSGTDADLTARICQYVTASAPTALYVQFDNVDSAGHNYGFGSQAHLNKITETDELIGLVYQSYVEKGIIDDTLFIVTTDHGGTQVPAGSYLGNHGGETPAEKEITFAAVGKTVVNGGNIENLEIRDTAAIVLHALGYEQPESWTARVPSGLFEGVTATDRPVWNKPAEPEKELSDYVSKDLIAHLTFDKTVADATGNYETEANGTAYYNEGYLGEALSVNNNSVSIENLDLSTNTLTFSTWIKVTNLVGSDPVVFANKSWHSGMNAGILVCVHSYGYIQVNIADGNVRTDLKVNYDPNALKEWMNVIVVIDRDESRVGLSINFGDLTFADLNGTLSNSSLNTDKDLVIGQDGTTEYTSYLKALVDDFMIFDGAFDQDDVAALATYYGEKASENESYRNHVSEPTPSKNSNGYVTNYIEDKDLLAYLTFDGNINDSTESYETSASNTPTYGSGYYGQAINVNKSAVNLNDFNPGANSITFATWLKITYLEGGDPVIFANKSWSSGKNAGILVCVHSSGELRVNVADGTNRTDFIIDYPTDMLNGWMHLIVVYDVEKNEIRVSFDFGEFAIGKLTPENYGDSIDGAYNLAIGEDGTNNYTAYIKGYIDEFMIFDGAFDQNDVSALEDYYNQY